MRWFKHMTDSRNDEKVARLIADGGAEAYGLWWMVLEIVASQMAKGSSKCSVTYPVSHWSVLLSLRGSHVRHKLSKLAVTGLVTVKWDGTDVTVTIPNLLKYRDEYQSRVGTKSRQSHDQEQIQNTEADTERETTSEHHGSESARELDKPPSPPQLREMPRPRPRLTEPPPVALFHALEMLRPDEAAVLRLWEQCRSHDPTATAREIAAMACMTYPRPNPRIANPMGLILKTVPDDFANGGSLRLRQLRESTSPQPPHDSPQPVATQAPVGRQA